MMITNVNFSVYQSVYAEGKVDFFQTYTVRLPNQPESLRFLEIKTFIIRELSNKTTRLGHNALAMCIITHGPPNEDVVMLIYAAGETLDSLNDARIPEFLKQQQIQRKLKHLCREAVRKHLLHLDLHTYLFGRIPQLQLPSPIARYLLYYVSLDR